jgi:AraC-like DNA-binding protein
VNALRTEWESVNEPGLAKLRADVQQDLRREWTLAELAHRSHCSPEHLRGLCMRELDRSPIQHLTCLHMGLAR